MTWPLCNCVVLCFVSHPCGVCQVLGIMCGVISFGLFVSCDRSGSGVTGCVFVSVRVAGHAGKVWSWFLIVTGCHAGVCSLEIYRNHYTVSPCVHSSKWHAAVCQGGLSFWDFLWGFRRNFLDVFYNPFFKMSFNTTFHFAESGSTEETWRSVLCSSSCILSENR